VARKKPMINGMPIEPTYAWVCAYEHEEHWHMIPASARDTRPEAMSWFMENEAQSPSGKYPDGAEVKIIKAILLARIGK